MLLGRVLTMDSPTLINWGLWFASPVGAMVTTMVSSTIAALVLIKSFRWFVKIQWDMWYGYLLSFALMVVLFFLTPTSVFQARIVRPAQLVSRANGLTYLQMLYF